MAQFRTDDRCRRVSRPAPTVPPRDPQSGAANGDPLRRLREKAALLCADCQTLNDDGQCMHGNRCVADLIFELLEGDDPPAGPDADRARCDIVLLPAGQGRRPDDERIP